MELRLDPDVIERRAALLGREFIAYVCNVDSESLANRLATGEPLDPPQERALQDLLQLAAEPLRGVHEEQVALSAYVDTFVFYDPDKRTSRAIAIRRAAGGQLPPVADEDATIELVRRLALDIYPATLIRGATPSWNFSPGRPSTSAFETGSFFGRALLRNPLAEDLADALMRDDEAGSLFPSTTNSGERSGRWTTSSGESFEKRPYDLPVDILGAAFHTCGRTGEEGPDAFIETAVSVLRRLRRLASGDAVDITGQVGFGGASAPAAGALTLPSGGVVRAAEQHRPMPPQSKPDDLVLDLEVDWRIIPSPLGETRSAPPNAHKLLDRAVEALRLAALTGIQASPPMVIREEWRRMFDPVSHRVYLKQGLAHIGPSIELDDAALASLERELMRLDTLDLKPLAIAIDRIISALDRRDPRDGFIDAVVAWEALFSDEPGEVTLRVTTAMTNLLTPKLDDRLTCQKELAELYKRRSKVLHGAERLNQKDAQARLERAVELSVRALRALLHDRPDLVPVENRSLRLILQAPPENA